jgi:hypothetical protein
MSVLDKLLILVCFLPATAFAFHNEGRIPGSGQCGTFRTSIPHGTLGDRFPIHQSGPPDQRYDIVLLPEGYSAEEQPLFVEHANVFKDALLNQFAFDTCLDNFNIWGVHVVSDDSGIDFPCSEHSGMNPQPCEVGPERETCPGGTDRLRSTYFNATLCHGKGHQLLDSSLARDVANQKLGCSWDATIVLVNDDHFFGKRLSDNMVYASTRQNRFPNVALHELGHEFLLGDEYCASWSWPFTWDPASAPMQTTEPSEHNWTYEQDPARIKWGDLFPPGVPIPTTENAGCSQCVTGFDPCPDQCVESSQECKPRCLDQLADDPCQGEPAERPSWCQADDWTVGLYSGMNHGRCGGFRPAFYFGNPNSSPTPTLCMMNYSATIPQFFCPVCSRAIQTSLSKYNRIGDGLEPNGIWIHPAYDPSCRNSSYSPRDPHDLGNLGARNDVSHAVRRRGIFSDESWRLELSDLSLHTVLDNDFLQLSLPSPERGAELECGTTTTPGNNPWNGLPTEETHIFNAAATVSIHPSEELAGEAVSIGRAENGLLRPAGSRATGTAFSKAIRCPFADFESLGIAVGREAWLASGCPELRWCSCPTCNDYSLSVQYSLGTQRIPNVSDLFRALLELEILSSLPCPHGGFFPRCQRLELEPLSFRHPPVPRPGECGPADGCRFYHAFVWEGTAPFELLFSSNVDLSYELLDITLTVIAEALPIDINGPGGSFEVLGSFLDDDERITKRLGLAALPPGVYVLLVTGTEATFSIEFEPPPPAPDSDGDGVPDPFDPCPVDAEDLDGTRDADGCPDPVIDIKPGQSENPVNLRSRGVIPVALLGEASLDVTQLDLSTLRFGRCGFVEASPAHELGGPRALTKHLEDINGDGFVDLVTHYRQQDAKFVAEDEEGCLVVQNGNGAPLLGIDGVMIF